MTLQSPKGWGRACAWPLFLLALGFAPAQAQTVAEATLAQTFERAWSLQPEAGGASARRDAAQHARQAAERWTVEPPALEAAVKTDRFTSRDGAREIDAGIAVPLWLPGERARAQGLADAELAALDSRWQAARLRLAGQVREAWWALQLARLDLATAQARQGSAQRLAADVARRVAAGDLSRADQHQADGALAGVEAEIGLAAAALAQARQALVAWGIAEPAWPAPPEAVPDAGTDPGAGAEPAATHPLLAEWADRVRLAQQALDLAAVQTRGNPELRLGTTRERDARGERDSRSLNFGLRIPLGSASGHRAKVAVASAERIEAERGLALEQQRLRADIAAAGARVQAAQASAAAAARRAQLAHETRGFYDKSFRLGETDLPTRLRAEAEAFEAQRQGERARIGVHQAISAWRQALGLPPQ